MKKSLRICLVWVGILLTFSALAQDRAVTGTVSSADDNSPLAGVTVSLKGTTRGTTTDAAGAYRLSVPDNATLIFSYVGFARQELAVGGRTTLNVALQSDAASLNEVVVTGYGSQIKRDLTGNIAQVKGAEIQNMPTPSVDQALQGRAAGVYVNAGSGKLGQGVTVRVRGSSSISASSQPFYVVDGIPVTTGDLGSYGGDTNPLADINFNDVESIEVLKDASAAAIYGSRAANGVVLITTKRGKAGKTNISLNYQGGISNAARRVRFLNAQEYVDFFKMAAGNRDRRAGIDPNDPDSYTSYFFGPGGFLDYYTYGTYGTAKQGDYDWQDKAFQQGGLQQVDLQFNGGNEKTKFYLSGQFYDQKGTIVGNALQRYTGRLNLDHQANKWLTVGLNMSLARTQNKRLPGDNAFSNPIQASAITPLTPFTDPNTNLPAGTPPGDVNIPLYYNPFISIDYASFYAYVYRNLAQGYAQVQILPNLRFRSELGVDILNQQEEGYFGSQTVRNQTRAARGIGSNTYTGVVNYTTNNYFNYDRAFGVHTLGATLGMSYQQSQSKFNSVEGTQFPSDAYQRIASAGTISSGSSSETNFRFLSYFLRANYGFANKYLLSVSGRIDGSSRFGKNARYGFFPAASAGWVLSEESFLKENRFKLSFLKLRASYGITGNAEIGNFPQRGLFSGAVYGGIGGQAPSQIGNPDLKWETTTQADVGIDFGFFNNRINGEVDYYVKKTSDLLLNVNIPSTSGFTTQFRNVGNLENKGWEFVLNTQNLVGKFSWTTSLNLAANRNKVTSINKQVIEAGLGGMANRAVEGQPIGVWFVPEYAGVDPANGDALWYKNTQNTDGTVDRTTTNVYSQAQRVVFGNPNPKLVGGITNTFRYGGIDLSIFFNGVYGNNLNFYGVGQYSSGNGIFEDNQTYDQLRAWTKQNPNTDVPEARYLQRNGNQASSRYIVDGSFLRLRTVTLGYNLPNTLTRRIGLDKARVYLSGMNLLTFTKYKGWDPEVNSDDFTTNIAQGNDFYTPPQPRTFLVGLNLGF
jgi:TonB-linked SusC/RagA family outer membrane protein